MPIRDVGDAIREQRAGSKHIRTKAQAVAVGLKAKRARGDKGGGVASAYLRGLKG